MNSGLMIFHHNDQKISLMIWKIFIIITDDSYVDTGETIPKQTPPMLELHNWM